MQPRYRSGVNLKFSSNSKRLFYLRPAAASNTPEPQESEGSNEVEQSTPQLGRFKNLLKSLKAFGTDPLTIKTAKFVFFAVITTPLHMMLFYNRFAYQALKAL